MSDKDIYLSGPIPRMLTGKCECPWCGVWVKKPVLPERENSCDCKVGGVIWNSYGCGVIHPGSFKNIKITK